MHGRNSLLEQQGSVTILVALATMALFGSVALAIDIGFGLVTKAELQNIADAAALAGGRELGRIYEGLAYDGQQNYVMGSTDRARIVAQASNVAQQNTGGNQSIIINDWDVRIGQWDGATSSLTVTNEAPTTVEVTARRDGLSNGPLAPFFARVIGVNSINVSSKATAGLSYAKYVLGGQLDLPLALAKGWFANQPAGEYCGTSIKFYPTGESCGGWNTFMQSPASQAGVEAILSGLLAGTYQAPEATSDVTQFDFNGGNMSTQTFKTVEDLYNARKDANGRWKTFIAVYDRNDCSNPTGLIKIVGFVTVIVTKVVSTGSKSFDGFIACEVVETARSGAGANYGTRGSIPGIVQ